MNRAVSRGKHSLLTEELPFSLYSRPDLCYHVHLDGNPVVSWMPLALRVQYQENAETATVPAHSPSSTAVEL
jgi:hypothetical protein